MPRSSSLPQQQWQVRAFQRLDRGLFVDAEHDRVLGRIQVEADDIFDLGRAFWVLADLVIAPTIEAGRPGYSAYGEMAGRSSV